MKTTFQIDPSHSSVNFSIKHMMIAKVHGAFEKVSGQLTYDSQNPESSSIEANIEAASINTREPARDTHLKSGDFFDVEKFPQISFRSTRVQVKDEGALLVTGELSIHGVSKSVVLEVEGPSEELKDPWGNVKMGISATTRIKRKDFGLNWNAALEAGGVLVGDDVNITLDIQFVKQA